MFLIMSEVACIYFVCIFIDANSIYISLMHGMFGHFQHLMLPRVPG